MSHSIGCMDDLAWLHASQAGTRFHSLCLPPELSGVTWSIVRLFGLPQYAQQWSHHRKQTC